MRNEQNPIVQLVTAAFEKKLRQSEFDHDYYIDVASGEVKKRLYVKRNHHKKVEVKKEE